MIRKQSTDPVFDQVSVCLSGAAHRNMNQKYIFLKKTLISDGLSILISYANYNNYKLISEAAFGTVAVQ